MDMVHDNAEFYTTSFDALKAFINEHEATAVWLSDEDGCRADGVRFLPVYPEPLSVPAEVQDLKENNDFVHAMNEYIFGQPQKYWFHQCGCDPDSRRIGYRGYQMFECWAPNAHDECAKAAEFVASKLGCNVVEA